MSGTFPSCCVDYYICRVEGVTWQRCRLQGAKQLGWNSGNGDTIKIVKPRYILTEAVGPGNGFGGLKRGTQDDSYGFWLEQLRDGVCLLRYPITPRSHPHTFRSYVTRYQTRKEKSRACSNLNLSQLLNCAWTMKQRCMPKLTDCSLRSKTSVVLA